MSAAALECAIADRPHAGHGRCSRSYKVLYAYGIAPYGRYAMLEICSGRGFDLISVYLTYAPYYSATQRHAIEIRLGSRSRVHRANSSRTVAARNAERGRWTFDAASGTC